MENEGRCESAFIFLTDYNNRYYYKSTGLITNQPGISPFQGIPGFKIHGWIKP